MESPLSASAESTISASLRVGSFRAAPPSCPLSSAPPELGREVSGAAAPGSFFLVPRIDAGRFCDPGYLAEWLRAANSELLAA